MNIQFRVKLSTPEKNTIHAILLLMLIHVISATTLNAQPRDVWRRFYDNANNADYLFDVFATVDGGYAMCGHTPAGQGIEGYWLVGVDGNGEELWQRTYVNEGFQTINNWCFSLIQADDGGFLLGGRVREGNVTHFSVLRTLPDGEVSWWREYGGDDASGQCSAIIELKSGEFVAVGGINGSQAYAVLLDTNGDILWENTYQGRWFSSLREVAGGLLIAGGDNNRDAWLLKTDFEGEVVWSRSFGSGRLYSLISCQEGGFAACGYRSGNGGDWLLIRVDDEGNELWSNTFDFGGNEWSHCLTQMWDNGFILVGENSRYNASMVLRTDNSGNEMWRRLDGNEENRMRDYRSVVVGNDGLAVAVGTGYCEEHGNRPDGVLTKIALLFSPPEIVFFSPQDLELNVLQGDSIQFIVHAEDLQEDTLSYFWILDEDTVATDTTTTIFFEELDDHTVDCFVSDGTFADSVQWIVHVEEFFIRSFEPDSLEFAIQRGTEVDFSIDVAALEEIEVGNTWNLTHRDQRQEELGNEEAVSVTFDQSGGHQLQALVTYEEESDEVTWTINVRSAIWSWWPSELEISTYVDSTLEFVITPFNEESDSLEYIWLLNEEPLGSDSASVLVTFPETRQYEITSIVHDGIEADTIRWTVNVEEWSFTTDLTDLTDLPSSPVLYSASPNPFNASIKLSMYLPRKNHVLLSVFDVNGREVSRLMDGNVRVGNQSVVWNASGFPAGVYVVRMDVGNVSEMRKVVLVR